MPLLQELLAQYPNLPVERALQGFSGGTATTGVLFGPGAFIIPPAAAAQFEPMVRELHLQALRLPSLPDVPRAKLRTQRVGIYKSWAASMASSEIVSE